jgi:serine protease AprX
MASWSSTGTTQDGLQKPDIAAPGSHMVSTLAPSSAFASMCPSCIVGGSYIRAGGTSMAAPVVSGAAALVFELHPDWTPAEVKSALLETTRSVSGTSIGEVDADAAVNVYDPPPSVDPDVAPNDIVDPASGDIDYTRSSWSRSSWSAAPDPLAAVWARSSWSCVCATGPSAPADPSRSSWSRSSWSTKWTY